MQIIVKLALVVSALTADSFLIIAAGANELSDEIQVISAILRESWMPGCTITFITDGVIHLPAMNKIVGDRVDFSFTVYEVSGRDLDTNKSEPASYHHQITRVRESATCLTLVIATDDEDFLADFVEGAVEHNVVIWPTRMLVVTKLPSRSVHHLRGYLAPVNAMAVTMEEGPGGKRFGIYVYAPYTERAILVAAWTPTRKLTYLSKLTLFPDKYRRFIDGAKLQVSAIRYPPHVYFHELPSSDSDEKIKYRITGTMKFLVDMVANKVNFTYDIIPPPIGSWGYGYPNGSWDGLVGMVLRKEADLAIGPAVVLYKRAKVVDYGDTLMVKYIRILGRRGSTEADPWGFVMPLAPAVWAATFATLLTILLLKGFLSHVKWEEPSLTPKIPLSVYVRAFLQQDIYVDPKSSWEKLILGAWLLTVLVLIEAYATTLISLLAFRSVPEPYHSLRAVLDDPKAKMIWFGNTAYTQFLEDSDSGIFKEVYDAGKEGRIVYISPQVYIKTVDRLVSQGDHVLMHPDLAMRLFLTEDFMEDGDCKFYFSKESLIPMAFSLLLPKDSPLSGPINNGIRAAVEGGLYTHWLESTMTDPRSCKNPPSKISVEAALSLTNTWGVFVTLAAGYAIAFSVFFLEVAVARLRKEPEKQMGS